MNDSKLYVGNFGYDTTEANLRDIFAEYGAIAELNFITDRLTGQSKGFAFITFEKQAYAEVAHKALNGKQINGRTLKVNPATKKGSGRWP